MVLKFHEKYCLNIRFLCPTNMEKYFLHLMYETHKDRLHACSNVSKEVMLQVRKTLHLKKKYLKILPNFNPNKKIISSLVSKRKKNIECIVE